MEKTERIEQKKMVKTAKKQWIQKCSLPVVPPPGTVSAEMIPGNLKLLKSILNLWWKYCSVFVSNSFLK